MGPFLFYHRNLVLGLVAAALWGGTFGCYFYRDIIRAWQAYRRRWMGEP